MNDSMAKLSVGFFSLLLVGGCSKAPEKEIVDLNQKEKPAASVKSAPVESKVFEAPDAQAGTEIREKVKALLAAADYEKIDQLAREYRKSMELNACGVPKVGEVYAALDLNQEAPEPDWQKQFAALRTWIKAKPESITARVALADLLVSYGWKARGSGYA